MIFKFKELLYYGIAFKMNSDNSDIDVSIDYEVTGSVLSDEDRFDRAIEKYKEWKAEIDNINKCYNDKNNS